MRGIYTPVTDIRRKVFTEVARMAYEVDDMVDFEYLMHELPYEIIEDYDLYINSEGLDAMGITVPDDVAQTAVEANAA